MQEAAEIGIEQQAVVDGAGRNRAADFVVLPDAPGLGDIAALGGIDGVQVPDALAVFGILAIGDEYFVFPDHGRGDHFVARLGPHGILGIHVELPQLLAGFGFVAADVSVAFAHDHLHHVADLPHRRRRPLPVQDALAHIVHFPNLLARLLIERDHRRRPRRRNVHVALVLPIRRPREQQVAVGNRRRVRHVVRRRSHFLDHVVLPDRLRPAVTIAVRVETRHFAAVGDVVQPIAFHQRRRAHPLERPVQRAPRGQLRVSLLPQEFAVRFAEAHQHTAVARLLRIAHQFVVRPGVNLPARHHRIAVALRTELRHPLHVLLGLQIPRRGNALHHREHVTVGRAAPHGPVARAWIGREQQPQRQRQTDQSEQYGAFH